MGTGTLVNTSLNWQTVKIFVFQVNAYQMLSTAEEALNNEVDKITLDVSQLLSQSTAVLVQWTHEQRGHGGKNGGHVWSQQHGISIAKDGLTTATAK